MIRLTNPSGDDWVARLLCRQEGREWTRWVGVNGDRSQAEAERIVRIHVNTPRRVRSGMACEISGLDICRMWEWRARQITEKAPDHFRAEVAGWQRNSERQAV